MEIDMDDEIGCICDMTQELIDVHDDADEERRGYVEAAGCVAVAAMTADADCAVVREAGSAAEEQRDFILMTLYHLLHVRAENADCDMRMTSHATRLIAEIAARRTEKVFGLEDVGLGDRADYLVAAGQRALIWIEHRNDVEARKEIDDAARDLELI